MHSFFALGNEPLIHVGCSSTSCSRRTVKKAKASGSITEGRERESFIHNDSAIIISRAKEKQDRQTKTPKI